MRPDGRLSGSILVMACSYTEGDPNNKVNTLSELELNSTTLTDELPGELEPIFHRNSCCLCHTFSRTQELKYC